MRSIFINLISLALATIGLYLVACAWAAADSLISTALSTGGLSTLIVGWMSRQFIADIFDAIENPFDVEA